METLFSGRVFDVVRKHAVSKTGRKMELDIVLHPGGVAVLPILPDGRIVLIRQKRYPVDEYLIELPAGRAEPGEEPIVTARRELVEETGYRADELVPITKIFTTPGIFNEEIHIFKATGLTPGSTSFDDGEQIETLLMDLPQAVEKVLSGEIRDSKTIIGILWYHQQVKSN